MSGPRTPLAELPVRWTEPLRTPQELHHYFDREHGMPATKIHPGQFFATRGDQVLVTVLGSCVSACIRDRALRIGGMNHFMLPEKDASQMGAWERSIANAANRYGNYAMESLLNGILRLGGKRENLEIKLFGGAQVIAGMSDVGARNIAFVREYLAGEGLAIQAHDLGGSRARKLCYFSASGRVLLRRLAGTGHLSKIASRDLVYRSSLEEQSVEGEVELFGP